MPAIVQAARPDPVRAVLVFLDLLERQAEGGGKPALAHPDGQAADADPVADMLVDWARRFLGHAGLRQTAHHSHKGAVGKTCRCSIQIYIC
jgi:hypothetical protein